MNVETLRHYLRITKDDWNYITPIDFYKNYFVKREDREDRDVYYLIDLRSNAEYKKDT